MITVHHGDSREVLKGFADASIESVVCDPPYGLNFMGKRWDTGETAFDPAFWADVLRVLKPGGHLIAFSGTRTYHRLACAIEDAGFEMRDMIAWLYGSGFPKSHDVSKAVEATVLTGGSSTRQMRQTAMGDDYAEYADAGNFRDGTTTTKNSPNPPGAAFVATTDAARQWQGWGTALKPALEPIVLARKPLTGTVAANVLAHGTGALNIDASRIGTGEDKGVWPVTDRPGKTTVLDDGLKEHATTDTTKGRWPANVIHDGSDEVVGAFPETSAAKAGGKSTGRNFGQTHDDDFSKDRDRTGHDDAGGSAARFFYSAKADAADRCGSKHPTVKPVDLMAYLVRLVTPPGGVTLDPFAGSGSTGMACLREGFDCILIEREAQYVADIHRRLAHVSGEDAPLFATPTNKVNQETLL